MHRGRGFMRQFSTIMQARRIRKGESQQRRQSWCASNAGIQCCIHTRKWIKATHLFGNIIASITVRYHFLQWSSQPSITYFLDPVIWVVQSYNVYCLRQQSPAIGHLINLKLKFSGISCVAVTRGITSPKGRPWDDIWLQGRRKQGKKSNHDLKITMVVSALLWIVGLVQIAGNSWVRLHPNVAW